MTVLIPPILLLQIKKAENRQIPIMGGKRLGVRQEGSHLIRSSSFMTIKFLSFEFHALNLLLSIDTKPVSKSTDIRFVNSLNILFIQSILSFLKSEIVRKSGCRPSISHITSRFVLHAASSFLDERIPFR